MPENRLSLTITHWLPIVTFCPVNNLPDLIFIEVTFTDFKELYAVRNKLTSMFNFRTLYMEEVANEVADEFYDAKTIVVKLMFNKHIVKIER